MREPENYCLRWEDTHKWYFFPKMSKDECIVFRQHSTNGDAQPVFHTSFADHQADVCPRHSIEVRAVAFFGESIDSEDVLHMKAALKRGKLVNADISPHE
eukprot:gnl/TRDRNA2_/TRDRNA2_169473_c0_seq3.p1 gnl/TRDRNA2_/TRDRNA2_169473_c0~~gnl/TRDRNA2_/TRDRNA2_169473_c0_seq3.p1  ORF type:complete len:100 (+),score=9.83 gnl/TRDRNA2_/TRDRNA2_169473_c0_seq3:360-659(+)